MQIRHNNRRVMLKETDPGDVVSGGCASPDPYIVTNISSGEDTKNCKYKVLINLRTGEEDEWEERTIVNSHPDAGVELED